MKKYIFAILFSFSICQAQELQFVTTYFDAWLAPDIPVTNLELDGLTHFIYFHIEPAVDPPYYWKKFEWADSGEVWQRQMIDSCNANGVVPVLCIGGLAQWQDIYAYLASDSTRLEAASRSIINYATGIGYKWLDFDLEGGTPLTPLQYEMLFRFFRRNLLAIVPDGGISLAAGRNLQSFSGIPPAWVVNAYIDQFNPMSYDQNLGGNYAKFHNALLDPSPNWPSPPYVSGGEAVRGIEQFITYGIQPHRLSAAIAWYSYETDLAPNMGQYYASADSTYFWWAFVPYRDIYRRHEVPDTAVFYDTLAREEYVRYISHTGRQALVLGYDGMLGTAARVNYAKDRGIGGIFIFAYDQGYVPELGAGNRFPLMAAVRANITPTAPAIATHPSNTSKYVGGTATFTVSATGTAPLTYQWQKNSVNIGGATSASYTTPVLVLGDNGNQYRCVVTNSLGSATSNQATLTVTNSLPIVGTHPANVTIYSGQQATFTVVATGTQPLSYQWQVGGVNIGGATSSSYQTPATTTADNGKVYRCVVTNTIGSATSNGATLTVLASSPPLADDFHTGTLSSFWVQTNPSSAGSSQLVTNGTFTSNITSWSSHNSATIAWSAGTLKLIGGQVKGATQTPAMVEGTTYTISADIFISAGSSINNAVISIDPNGAIPADGKHAMATGKGSWKSVSFSRTVGAGESLYLYALNPGVAWGTSADTVYFDNVSVVESAPIAASTASLTGAGTVDALFNWAVPSGSEHTGLNSPRIMQRVTYIDGLEVKVQGTLQTLTTQKDCGIMVRTAGSSNYLQFGFQWTSSGVKVLGRSSIGGVITDGVSYSVANAGTMWLRVTHTGDAWSLSYSYDSTSYLSAGSFTQAFTTDSVGLYASNRAGLTSPAFIASFDYFWPTSSPIANEDPTTGTPPTILTQPTNLSGNAGATVQFTQVVSGSGLSYLWERSTDNGATWATAPGTSDALNYTTPTLVYATHNNNRFRCTITNVSGSVTTNEVVLTVNVAPSISVHPVSATIDTGKLVTFALTASGIPTPTYQWQKDGTNINGATGAAYTFTAYFADSGSVYRCIVTNTAGADTSDEAILHVVQPPTFLPQIQVLTPTTGDTLAAGASTVSTANTVNVSSATVTLIHADGNVVLGTWPVEGSARGGMKMSGVSASFSFTVPSKYGSAKIEWYGGGVRDTSKEFFISNPTAPTIAVTRISVSDSTGTRGFILYDWEANDVEWVKVYYRRQGESSYKLVTMTRNYSPNAGFGVSGRLKVYPLSRKIYTKFVVRKSGIESYIEKIGFITR